MYFLKYFSQNFHFILRAEGGEGGTSAPSESVRPEARPNDLREQALKNLTPEQQKRLENLDAIKKEVEALQASEKIVGGRLDVIGKRLLQIKENPTEKANPDDKEYGELVEVFDSLEAEYKTIAKDNSQTSHILSYYLQQFEGEVDEQISDVWKEHNESKTQEGLELDKDIQDENKAFTEDEMQKKELLILLESFRGAISREQADSVLQKYQIGDVSRWGQEAGKDTSEKRNITLLLSAIDDRNFDNLEDLKTIEVESFLSQVPHEKRLNYFSYVGEGYNPKIGDNIGFTFRFSGELNNKLESGLTAGSIIPETISQIKVGDIVYSREGLQGEFISIGGKGEGLSRLIIREGDSISIEKIVSSEDISKEKNRIEKEVSGKPDREKEMVRQRLLKGLGNIDDSTKKVLQDSLPDLGEKNYNGAVEKAITNLATTPGIPGNRLSKLEGKGIIGFIWNLIVDMLQDPKSPVSKAGSVESYAQSVGLSAEELKQFGNTGAQLAAWIQSIGYRKFVDKKWNCGANVGECLEAFGFKGLPEDGRDGHLWAKFCKERPTQFKKFSGPVNEAPAGSIISYKKNTGGSDARQKYGHVEIAMGNDTGYYFGQLNKKPGGSNSNPKPGDYEIYVPISKVPKRV